MKFIRERKQFKIIEHVNQIFNSFFNLHALLHMFQKLTFVCVNRITSHIFLHSKYWKKAFQTFNIPKNLHSNKKKNKKTNTISFLNKPQTLHMLHIHNVLPSTLTKILSWEKKIWRTFCYVNLWKDGKILRGDYSIKKKHKEIIQGVKKYAKYSQK